MGWASGLAMRSGLDKVARVRLRLAVLILIAGLGLSFFQAAVVRAQYVTHPGDASASKKKVGEKKAAAPASQEQIHRVAKGETLSAIGRKYGVSVEALKKVNGLRGNHIIVGQKLRLPKHTKGSSAEKLTTVPEPGRAAPSRNPPEPSEKLTKKEPDSPKKKNKKEEDDEKPAYRFLTRALLREIDAPRVVKGRWKYIVLHHSGTPSGDAKIFEYYHKNVRHMENGLAYHFVIGNGNDSGDGEIEVGNRWRRQIKGGHVANEALNPISIGICFVGNFNERAPSAKQMAAAIELVTHLQERCGSPAPEVFGHREMKTRGTECPGSRFPLSVFHKLFNE